MHVLVLVAAHVADMAENVALGVLCHGAAEMGANAPVDQAHLLDRVTVARQAADQGDAEAVLDFSLQQPKRAREALEREVPLPDVGDLPAGRLQVAQRGVDLGDLLGAQPVDPVLTVLDVPAEPCCASDEFLQLQFPHCLLPC